MAAIFDFKSIIKIIILKGSCKEHSYQAILPSHVRFRSRRFLKFKLFRKNYGPINHIELISKWKENYAKCWMLRKWHLFQDWFQLCNKLVRNKLNCQKFTLYETYEDDDERNTMTLPHTTLWHRWAKRRGHKKIKPCQELCEEDHRVTWWMFIILNHKKSKITSNITWNISSCY